MWDLIGGLASGIGNYFAAKEQSKAAQTAADAQLQANREQLAQQQAQFGQALGFQQNQFDANRAFQQGLFGQATGQANAMGQQQLGAMQGLFAPFVQGGQQGLGGLNQFASSGLGGYQGAIQGQQALSGALGPEAQAAAINGIQSGPLFSGLARQGEDAILQNASATGGLRGGNTQAALAQFRPQLLNQLIQQQFANLGSLGGLGAQGAQGFGTLGQLGASAAANQAQGGLGVLQSQLGLQSQLAAALGGNIGNASNQLASNAGNLAGAFSGSIADLLGQQGAAQAGNALAQGRANAGLFSGLGGNINQLALLKQLQGWGGLGSAAQPALGANDAANLDLLKSFGLGGR